MRTPLLSLLVMGLFALFSACSSEYPEPVDDTLPTDLQLSTTLSNQRISSIAEDANGYIWIGTSRGLNRYNGDEMHQYFCNDQPNAIPDNRIYCVFCDSKGRIWITTKNGVARYTEQDDFEAIPINYRNPRCQNMVENSRGDIFVSQTNEILKYDPESNCFERAISDVSYIDPFMQQIFVDEEDNLWVIDDRSAVSYSTTTFRQLDKLDLGEGSEIQTAGMIGRTLWLADANGLHIYDVVERHWTELPDCIRAHPLYNMSRMLAIIPMNSETLLLSTASDGLFIYNTRTQHLMHQGQSEFPFAAPGFAVQQGLVDSNGNVWLCSASQGFTFRQQQSRRFSSNNPFYNGLYGKPVVSVKFDEERHQLWAIAQDEGLYCYDIQTGEIRHFDRSSILRPSHSAKRDINRRANTLFIDHQHDLWLATYPRGLAQLRQKGEKLELINYFNLPVAIDIQEDLDHTIWIGCYGNSYYSKRASDSQFLEHHLFSNTFSYLSCIELLHDGRVATLERERGLHFINPETQEQSAPVIPDSVLQTCIARSIFLPSALKEDHEGRLWIGTISNGLMCYDPVSGTLEHIKGAPCEDIASIEVDKMGDLWVSTQYGLGKYNVKTQSFTNYYSTDGLGGNEYYDRVSCQLPDGTLVFGGSHGLTVFNPNNVPETQTAHLRLEDLKIHNQLVRPAPGAAIEKHLSLSDAIQLNHRQNSISISFSSLDFSEEERFNYQYMLEGFNHTWVDAGTNREAFYANLWPCQYTFRLRITNKDRDQVLAETSIPVIIHPAIWATWWARLLYILLGLMVITYIIRLYRRIRQEKRNRLLSQREKEHEHRINQMNMNFFANVSHEFRTPLTVISGPIKQLCQDSSIAPDQHHLLQVVNRSVTRMLQLVNQMMDFHKLEEDTLKLEVKRQDVVSFLKNVAEFFAVNAHDKGIDFRTHGVEDMFLMWTDLDKLEKILNNLLGNAMKYSPAGSRVDLSLDVISSQEAQQLFPNAQLIPDMQYAKISVSDNGPGIPVGQRQKVFERYYQLRNSPDQSFNWGTGIGLYYAHSLVRLHHGQIGIFDNPEGQGANFCFIVPTAQSAYTEAEMANTDQRQTSLFPIQEKVEESVPEFESSRVRKFETPQTSQTPQTPQTSQTPQTPQPPQTPQTPPLPHLLVIDDDVEVIHYLKLLLGKDYRVTCRFDATTALETLRQQDEEVDLVISDVMMPGTTGFQLCQQIKDDDQLCHLPVILVTAKNSVQDQIAGLNAGAMAYVTKPFDPDYLKALIQRLIGTRDQTRRVLQESTQASALDDNALSAQDRAFITELYRLMEEELSNPDMDVTRLTDLLHVSRSKLYYKIKGLTGENPSSFFKTYKLNRAAELIREGKYNLSEISLLTGFSTLSHFSTSFKRHFGVAPSEY